MEPRTQTRVSVGLIIGAFFVYALLNLVGIWSGRPAWSIAAFLLVLAALMWPFLRRGHIAAWSLWLGVAGLLAWAAWRGRADSGLDAIPIVVNVALAWLFARTLRAGQEPLITRLVRMLEGRHRLSLAGVRSYTRNLTLAWAVLLSVQAMVLAAMWLQWNFPSTTATFAIAAAPNHWTHAYARFGCYLVIGTFFVCEYAFRRWRLRHLPHADLRSMITRIVCIWPKLLRGT